MKAAVISMRSKSSKMIVRAMEKYFDNVDSINIRDIEVNLQAKGSTILCNGEPLESYDCAYLRASFRYVPLLRTIASTIYKTTYTPIKPMAFTLGHDKIITQLVLEQGGIPMPTTYLSSSAEAARQILRRVNYPIIMKFPEGTQGKGVMYADSFASANSMLDALTVLKQPFLIQEYIETGGTDTRALVIGEKIVASMKRKAVEGEKRANIHIGAKAEPVTLDMKTRKIAIAAAKAIGAEICAVDMLEGAKGSVVIEVNLSPGMQGITETTSIDVPDKIAKYLFEKTKDFVEGKKKIGAQKIMEDTGIIETQKEVITTLDFRGNRILLPEIISNITKFDDKDEIILTGSKGKLFLRKFNVEK